MRAFRLTPRPLTVATAALVACASACAPAGGRAGARGDAPVLAEDVRASLFALSADSMEGRMTGSPGGARAARFIAERLRAYGVAPAGDSGYFQRVPLALIQRPSGRRLPALLPGWADFDTVPRERRLMGVNVVGLLRGRDPAVRDEAVLVDAHYDHLGIGPAVAGDSIYNGADDDASGVVAVLEIARALARGPAPRRTVVFLATTGEEIGLLGTRWYIDHPVVPLDRTVSNLEVEMIGRPDSLAGGSGRAWLTGYERSTMGDALKAAGIPIVADPRPSQNFFERSDNIAFARRGIPAHTLSSFGLHEDYHTPADGPERTDVAHMTRVIEAAVRAVRILADSAAPQWKEGMRPAAP
jgi:hypothetical protein